MFNITKTLNMITSIFLIISIFVNILITLAYFYKSKLEKDFTNLDKLIIEATQNEQIELIKKLELVIEKQQLSIEKQNQLLKKHNLIK